MDHSPIDLSTISYPKWPLPGVNALSHHQLSASPQSWHPTPLFQYEQLTCPFSTILSDITLTTITQYTQEVPSSIIL
jgi:hypothetical protein